MSYPIELKEKAVKLRKRGYSLKEITEKLGIAKSTASAWLSDLKLNEKAQERLKKREILGQYKANLTKKRKRKRLFRKFRNSAKKDLASIARDKETCRLLCSVLYWCEGSKSHFSCLRFTNSEPGMIECFLYLLRKGFGINEQKLKALIHLHDYHDESEQIKFWSKITKIPKENFHKSYRKPNTGKRIRENYPGCLAITYYDSRVAKQLWAYYKEVQKKFS